MNGVSTTYSYTNTNGSAADPFDRLSLAKRALSIAAEETHTAFSYPNLTTVTEKQDQVNLDDGAIVSTIGSAGRTEVTMYPKRTSTGDPGGQVKIDGKVTEKLSFKP